MDVIRVHCCIVGGGPAGVMAGALLARAGIRVVVLEQHGDFLRDFRGDTVHPSTMDVLAELGWLDEFLKRPHQKVSRMRARVGDRDIGIADFSHAPTRCKFIAMMPQWDFLDFVVGQARKYPAFDLRMNATATGLVEELGRVVGVFGEMHGEPFEVRADLVLVADGRRSLLRERAGLRVIDRGAPMDVLWFRLPWHKGDPPESMGWVAPGRMVVTIHRGDYWQIGFLVHKDGYDDIRAKGIEDFHESLAETAPFLRDRLGEVRSFDDVKLLVVQVDRLEQWWKPGLLCIGDAAHAMSPIGGVGINLAIQDAVAAANLLAEPLRARTLTDEDLERVQRRRELPTRATQAAQVAIQNRVIRPVLHGRRGKHLGFSLRALDRWPVLQRIPARLIGVGLMREHVH
jgi:2-polyprenyl-6-methoxyphenol hydroxylase-like FAD-dependent oxidoreductase